MREVLSGWRRIPFGWKKFVVLALAGWAVEAVFGFEGIVVLLFCLFLAGLVIALLSPRRGRGVSRFAVDEMGGQIADLVSLPLLLPAALGWWHVAVSGSTDHLAAAIGYTALFLGAKFLLPRAIQAAFEPGAWSGGKRRRRTRRTR